MTKTDPPRGESRQRSDKWLWHARFFKNRRLAADLLASGRVRLNGVHLRKPSANVRVGDTLTFVQAKTVRVIRIRALAPRRGPPSAARALYDDLSQPGGDKVEAPDPRAPDKKDRRKIHLS